MYIFSEIELKLASKKKKRKKNKNEELSGFFPGDCGSGVTGGGRLLTGKFLLTYQENRGKEKSENGAENKENLKRKVENLKRKEEKLQNEERTFFVLFCFVFVFLFVCLFGWFFFAFHFSKRLKFVFGLLKWEFFTGKKVFHAEKKIRKNDFAPSEKYSCYAPGLRSLHLAKNKPIPHLTLVTCPLFWTRVVPPMKV